uniref:RxLR effector protein n=1 Tax=Panagrellus redivivus TaxID=6233 RepID=A0A7E4ULZ7_PANRE
MAVLLYHYVLAVSIGCQFSLLTLAAATSRPSHRHRRFQPVDFLFDTDDDPDTSGCPPTATVEFYEPADLARAHHGLFKDILWTKEERLQIRDLHATNQYHLLGPLLKSKLNQIDAPIELRRKFAAFFAKSYPPKEVRQLQTDESKCAIRAEFATPNPNMTTIQNILLQRLFATSSTAQKVIQNYIVSNMSPRQEP